MRACASLHADQASRTLLEKRKQLASAKLAANDNSAAFIYTMDLEDALCEVNTNCGKLGHGWLLCSGRQHPNYGATRRREQEPSTPSIEMAFAKLKAHLRKAAERSITTLWDKIGAILNLYSPEECQNFFKHAGYA